jgi:hypothetical protein
MSPVTRPLCFVGLTALLSLVPGCREPSTPPTAETATATPAAPLIVEIPDQMHDEGDGGEISYLEMAAVNPQPLPDDFPPPGVPMMAEPLIVTLSPRSDGALSLTYATPEERDTVTAYYREDLAVQGWETVLDSHNGGMTTLSARNADGSRLVVNIIENQSAGRTIVGLYHRPATARVTDRH